MLRQEKERHGVGLLPDPVFLLGPPSNHSGLFAKDWYTGYKGRAFPGNGVRSTRAQADHWYDS